MARNASSGSANRTSPSMNFNRNLNFKNNNFQRDSSKTNNFMKGKPATKPFKNI